MKSMLYMAKPSRLVKAVGGLLQLVIPTGLTYQTIKTRRHYESLISGLEHWLVEGCLEIGGDVSLGFYIDSLIRGDPSRNLLWIYLTTRVGGYCINKIQQQGRKKEVSTS